MKVFLIGNGGRENALAKKIFESDSFSESQSKMYFTSANPGIEKYASPVNIKITDIDSLLNFAKENNIDYTVTGPEIPLSLGITDAFEKFGLKIFGPSQKAAEIESSKVFAKKLMKENNIPTAEFVKFSRDAIDEALTYISACNYPVVFKADGLAAGKGVVILSDKNEAEILLKSFMKGETLSDTGNQFILEEYLSGEEVSVFAVCDGTDFIILPFSQDHKRISDGETGLNTGGMGAVAPVKKFMSDELTGKINNKIIKPVLTALKNQGREYKGCLYCGLMIVNDEPYVIEFNCRFGDPETQAVLPLIESDFTELLMKSSEGELKNYTLKTSDKYSCCVVLASKGYPGSYEKGKIISGLEDIDENCYVYHSGTISDKNNKIISNGGRVLSVVGISDKSIEDARFVAYENIEKIKFENMYYRKDIGFRLI